MNAFCGMVRLDGGLVDRDTFARCEFESVHWKPDHKEIIFRENAAFASTLRFVTPESKKERMPLVHADSGVVIVSDSYLTYKQDLSSSLAVDEFTPDGQVILSAYLKWGEDCAKYLSGDFSFAVWDPRHKKMLLVADRAGARTCFYAFDKNRYLIFANTMAPFRILCPKLTVNHQVFSSFAIDLFDNPSTCYAEVKGLRPAHQAVFFETRSRETRYWNLREHRRRLPYKKREEFYEAFRELFVNAVRARSRTSFPLMAHISGGLDSSSVAAVAATLLTQEKKTLYAFTAIPKDLEGPSHRSGWVNHELPRIQKALQAFSNVEHLVFRTDVNADPFEELTPLFPFIDRPFRNISNTHWYFGALKEARRLQSRSLLTGQAGNGSLSWKGISWKGRVRGCLSAAKVWLRPDRAFGSYFHPLNRDFVNKRATRRALRRRTVVVNPHLFLLTRSRNFALGWGMRATSLWYGVETLDPTADTRLQEFCYSAPQWIYYKGKDTLERRLLVRDALAGVVPEEIRCNPDRGEQAADWYLQYNAHSDRWRQELNRIASPASPLWNWYDQIAIDRIFSHHGKIEANSRLATQEVSCLLMRCLSLSFFLSFLEQQRTSAGRI